jgi:hypothetical protein
VEDKICPFAASLLFFTRKHDQMLAALDLGLRRGREPPKAGWRARPSLDHANGARAQRGDGVDAEHRDLAVEHNGVDPQREHGTHDKRIAPRPIEAAPRKQRHALTYTADEQAVAVELDLMDPAFAGRRREGSGRDSGAKRRGHEARNVGTFFTIEKHSRSRSFR